MTGDLTGKHHKDSKKSTSEIGYAYAGSGYGGIRTGSEKGFTLRSKFRINQLASLFCKVFNLHNTDKIDISCSYGRFWLQFGFSCFQFSL